jgi:hypothetical protein
MFSPAATEASRNRATCEVSDPVLTSSSRKCRPSTNLRTFTANQKPCGAARELRKHRSPTALRDIRRSTARPASGGYAPGQRSELRPQPSRPDGRPSRPTQLQGRHSTLTFELRALEHFAIQTEARARVAAWIDEYNRDGKHSACDMRSPIDHELGLHAPASPTRGPRRDRYRPRQHRAVLAGVNATPCGWPAASVDTNCGRHPPAPVEGWPQRKINRSRST